MRETEQLNTRLPVGEERMMESRYLNNHVGRAHQIEENPQTSKLEWQTLNIDGNDVTISHDSYLLKWIESPAFITQTPLPKSDNYHQHRQTFYFSTCNCASSQDTDRIVLYCLLSGLCVHRGVPKTTEQRIEVLAQQYK